MKKYSIIIPVYNIDKYISRCIDSIVLNSRIDNYEILLIDDGSTDNSSHICKVYAASYSNVYYYRKKNGGLSDARNYGICRSNGQYIIFVDGDDYVEGNQLINIDACINSYPKADVILLNGFREDGNQVTLLNHYDTTGLISGIDYLSEFNSNRFLRVEAWLAVCKRDFIISNNIFFKEGRLHEDALWFISLLYNNPLIINSNVYLYHYVIRENSISTQKSKLRNVQHIQTNCYELWALKPQMTKQAYRALNEFLATYYLDSFKLLTQEELAIMKPINRKFILWKPRSLKTTIKAVIFIVNPWIYWRLFTNDNTIKKTPYFRFRRKD